MPFLDKLVGKEEGDRFFFFTSGRVALYHILYGTYFDIARKTGKNHFLIEGHFPRFQELGCVLETPLNTTYQGIAETISPRTALLSLSWADPLTGVINEDLPLIANLCKERAILFHLDGTHVIGKGDFSWPSTGADLFTFDNSLYVKKGIDFAPLYPLDTPFNLLLEAERAAEEAWNQKDFIALEQGRKRHLFEEECLLKIPETSILHRSSLRVPHMTALQFACVHPEALLFHLHRKGISAKLGITSLTFTEFSDTLVATLVEKVAHLRKHGILE